MQNHSDWDSGSRINTSNTLELVKHLQSVKYEETHNMVTNLGYTLLKTIGANDIC